MSDEVAWRGDLRGCICPAGANRECEAKACPRQSGRASTVPTPEQAGGETPFITIGRLEETLADERAARHTLLAKVASQDREIARLRERGPRGC